MKVESGFLGKGGAPSAGDENEGLSGLQPLAVSATGFFRLLIGRHLRRKVVIKSIKEQHRDNPVAVAQLRKEFLTLFPLDFPNVVRVFSWIEVEGIPAIEMEWCDGADVRALLAEGLSHQAAIDIIRGVLQALRDIHRAGIIHRDIKPENVVYDSFRKTVKVIDFGCAYLTGGLTLQGPNGTPGYTPEEKMESDSEAEPRDDLYALGVMVAEMGEAMKDDSNQSTKIKASLLRFSASLVEGKYFTADDAAEAFESLLSERKGRRFIFIGVISVVLLLTGLLVSLYYPYARTIPEESAPYARPDTVMQEMPPAVSQSTDIGIDATISHADHPGDKPSSGLSTAEEGSAEESLYKIALNAGPLLQSAESPSASEQTKMDAFVVKFCDSVCMAEQYQTKYPPHMELKEIRILSKKLSDEYAGKMERGVQSRFGSGGDPARRRLLLEGRFYAHFSIYNHNPYNNGSN